MPCRPETILQLQTDIDSSNCDLQQQREELQGGCMDSQEEEQGLWWQTIQPVECTLPGSVILPSGVTRGLVITRRAPE